MTHRRTLLAAALFGATGVAAGAFGAHLLRPFLLGRGTRDAWETGVRFHLLHASALVGLAAWMRREIGELALRRAAWAARLWCAGIALFSGSLYLLAAGGPAWLGPATPLGGASLIAGWIFLGLSARAGGAG
jgi:uncharacterized membrane protein YgdD (TMEM256/DUF423 family)